MNEYEQVITINITHYAELVSKAAKFDAIVEDIKDSIDDSSNCYSTVNDSLVLAITGMNTYRRKVKAEREAAARARAAELAKAKETKDGED